MKKDVFREIINMDEIESGFKKEARQTFPRLLNASTDNCYFTNNIPAIEAVVEKMNLKSYTKRTSFVVNWGCKGTVREQFYDKMVNDQRANLYFHLRMGSDHPDIITRKNLTDIANQSKSSPLKFPRKPEHWSAELYTLLLWQHRMSMTEKRVKHNYNNRLIQLTAQNLPVWMQRIGFNAEGMRINEYTFSKFLTQAYRSNIAVQVESCKLNTVTNELVLVFRCKDQVMQNKVMGSVPTVLKHSSMRMKVVSNPVERKLAYFLAQMTEKGIIKGYRVQTLGFLTAFIQGNTGKNPSEVNTNQTHHKILDYNVIYYWSKNPYHREPITPELFDGLNELIDNKKRLLVDENHNLRNVQELLDNI